MYFRRAVICSLTFMLLFAMPAAALAELRPMNDGKPVQTRVIEPARDMNHEERQWQYQPPLSRLEQSGGSKIQADSPGFQVPLRRGLSNNNPGLFTIAAFVDHDPTGPDNLLDWNCGDRTYDAEDSAHNGTDYNGSPYPWLQMANDGVIVVAAADGEILDIHDGETDQRCTHDPTSEPNFVVLLHSDGTITIYAHLKTGSVTPRKIGEMVEQGDYLGVMSSSGQSTGPHLHLEVQDLSSNIFDPYAGDCNASNNESFWAQQESYAEKMIMDVATHSAVPEWPPCPQQEVPYFSDLFGPDDTIFLSVTVRDFEGGDEIALEIRDPSGAVAYSDTFRDDAIGFRANYLYLFGLQSSNSDEGEYLFNVTYGGETRVHKFYIGAGPEPPPAAVPGNNAFTGLWFDFLLDGEGFNIVTADGGTIVYFYGSDSKGNRLWLISALIPGEIVAGQPIEVLMYESTGGTFSSPVQSSRALSAWGTLILTFSGCMDGQSTLNGADGTKVSQISKLAGIAGASCVEGDALDDSGQAGLWFHLDGEGYNLIVAPGGRILYYYGFNKEGLRLWLISALITETLEVGKTVEIAMYESTEGTFNAPVPSGDALVVWGSAEITVIDCDTVTIVITGTDGSKTSHTVRLAGIIGVACPA